jgi:mannose/fructose/N-acetylgalactosamine-specific phosphotransferase system component IIB
MKNKFNYIFIIGCEGTGHHLFENCELTHSPYTVLHNLIVKYFNINTTPTEQKKLKKNIYEITKNNIGAVCKESSSFPYGRPTNPLISHDILGFFELFNEMEHVNLFYVVLTRNIIFSTLSSSNRFDKNKSIVFSSRLQENCLNNINSQIQLIPKEKYIIVELTNIQKNIEDFIKIIEEKSKIKISCNYNNIRIADDSKYLTDKNYDYLVNYFNKNRLKQFKFLKENTFLL